MNPRHPEPLDPVTKQPRRIPWTRWLMYAAGGVQVLSAATWLALRSYMTISVAPDTTVLTAPLLADGYPDYIGYLDAANAAGVRPEENAWIAILRCCGPEEIDQAVRAEHYRKLGMESLPDEGVYLRSFYDTPRLKAVPEPVLIAASVAAQLPWHTRFVRLAALNGWRYANGSEYDTFAVPLDPAAPIEPELPLYDSLARHVEQTAQLAAQAAWDFAEDPESASVQWTFEANEAAAWNFDNDDEVNIQDLRPEALAKIKPAFAYANEEQVWRNEIFETTRDKLWEREDLIMLERPWTSQECPLGAHWIASYSPHLDQLRAELLQRKKMYVPQIRKPGDNSMSGAYLLPAIQMQRLLALSYASRANLYRGEKKYAAALDDLIAIQQLGALLPQHPYLVEELVCIAVEGIGYACLGPLIQSSALTDEQLGALDIRLAQVVHLFDLVDCLDHGERLSSIGQVIATVVRGDSTYLQLGKDKNDPHWEQKIVHWDSVLREMNERFDQYRDAAKTKNFVSIRNLEQFYETQPANRKELEAYYENPPWYLLPSTKTEVMKFKNADSFSPAFASAFGAVLRATVRRDLVRVMIDSNVFAVQTTRIPRHSRSCYQRISVRCRSIRLMAAQ